MAQLVAHLLCKQGVRGSSPLGSTSIRLRRPSGVAVLLSALLLAGPLLAGCREVPAPVVRPPVPPETIAGTPSYDARREPAQAVLALVPESATTLSVTDLDEVRKQLGVPDLTSADLMADRSAFWRRAEAEAPLLTAGLLRADNSELMLDYGFTQDDVDWEARFTGPEGSGFVLAFREDLDLSAVARAAEDGVGPLGDATVLRGAHLAVSGVAADGATSWAKHPEVVDLLAQPAEATYVRRACVPVNTALGPSAGFEEQQALLATYDVTRLEPLGPFAVAFGDHLATVRVDPGRGDLFARLELAAGWPAADGLSFADGFRAGVADPATGRIGFDVPKPPLAARLSLLELLPFAVCNELDPIAEPTGQ